MAECKLCAAYLNENTKRRTERVRYESKFYFQGEWQLMIGIFPNFYTVLDCVQSLFAVKSDWNEREGRRDRRAVSGKAAICEQLGRQPQRAVAGFPAPRCFAARRSHPLFFAFVPVGFHSKRETTRCLIQCQLHGTSHKSSRKKGI